MSVAIVRDSCSVDLDENVASESKLMSIVGVKCQMGVAARISKFEDLKGAGAGAEKYDPSHPKARRGTVRNVRL